jgi:NAD-dependent SIR2 family protein deacetylase
MPECQNCGAFVTRQYVRVFAPNGRENPRVCPDCENKVRDGAEIREIR